VAWHAGEKPKLPVCFLTNGGGVTEAQKAEELSGWLDVHVHENQACVILPVPGRWSNWPMA
jgi:ribonucleotide monophosphatase NagD (HAD superfamily)